MRKLLFATILISLAVSCKKDTEYIYEVDPVTVRKDDNLKSVEKTTVEFISIAYADVFGQTISQNQLGQLSLLYLSFGDKRLIEDMLIKNMFNSQSIQLPSEETMRADVTAFVNSIYLKLFNRLPNELEAFTLKKKISDNTSIMPDMVYYSMMTSDEYRFY